MDVLKNIFNHVLRLVLGHTAVDNGNEWHDAHKKANASRAEIQAILEQSDKSS